ncbi:LOB domain-containing protein 20 [Malania oleifera]|uniref:LOB domain-containing protein 20 n=1 Tax=Malania oleifera TaxID=397392 RepID=UPI0025AE17EB|nr:LOB domain-containing protein 20 [Malania oleifera]
MLSYIYIYISTTSLSASSPPSMAEPPRESRRKGTTTKQPAVLGDAEATAAPSTAPCGACKFLRRRCISGCIFAPHFGSDQGAARFAAVHKVFGASNVSKLLLHIPMSRRHDAVVTISYEAQARLSDPVYGCVSTVVALKQQVAALQAELAMVQTQLISSRLAVADALQSSQQQQQLIAVMQPAYSNNSSASNNDFVNINTSSFTTNLEISTEAVDPSSHTTLEPLQFCQQSQDEEDEKESQNPITFANQIFHPR